MKSWNLVEPRRPKGYKKNKELESFCTVQRRERQNEPRITQRNVSAFLIANSRNAGSNAGAGFSYRCAVTKQISLSTTYFNAWTRFQRTWSKISNANFFITKDRSECYSAAHTHSVFTYLGGINWSHVSHTLETWDGGFEFHTSKNVPPWMCRGGNALLVTSSKETCRVSRRFTTPQTILWVGTCRGFNWCK
jgi:5-methylcytosine-specific restriction endonuclease McrBC GTP-binding regulatory subunit McrB